MDVDPLASMRCWAIEIELGGRLFTVPPLPAADWWPVLVSADPTKLLDLLTSTPEIDLDEMILAGALAGDDLGQVLLDAVHEVTGRPFQAAYALATVAQIQWPMINGRLAEHGFRWDVMPIGAALDAIYAIVVGALPDKSEDGKRKPREEFLALLDKPLPGQKREIDREKLVNDFAAMAGPMPTSGAVAKTETPPTSGVRSTGGPSGSARPRTPQRPRRPRQGGRSREPRPRPSPPG